MKKYKIKQPKYCRDQIVEFKHHNGNTMIGKIVYLETHYSHRERESYHIYCIHKEGNKISWWIGEQNILMSI